ncbi:MAG: hypothetical protein WCQ69_10775, partial [Bacteroidales bacterium]
WSLYRGRQGHDKMISMTAPGTPRTGSRTPLCPLAEGRTGFMDKGLAPTVWTAGWTAYAPESHSAGSAPEKMVSAHFAGTVHSTESSR